MKHKHADMIDAKADNMDLILFVKTWHSGWIEVNTSSLPSFHESDEYFLCLPKHKEAVLHCLNGCNVEVSYIEDSEYNCVTGSILTDLWDAHFWYMRKDFESRIKPRKETRWAAYTDAGRMGVMTYSTKEQLDGHYGGCGKGYQAVSFEVEV